MSEQETPLPPKPRNRAWQRWQMASLEAETGAPDSPDAPDAPVTPPKPEEVDPRALIAQWREQAEQQGYELGYAQGLEAGRRDGLASGREAGEKQGHAEALAQRQEENAALHARLHDIVRQADTAAKRLDREVGDALIRLALDIAQDIVRAELRQRTDAIVPLVREVLALHYQQPILAMRLHPDDYAVVQSQLPAELAATGCRLSADASLQVGDCLAETTLGDIDATLRARWRQHAEALGVEHEWAAAAPPASPSEPGTGQAQADEPPA